jgi:hypothetical protein
MEFWRKLSRMAFPPHWPLSATLWDYRAKAGPRAGKCLLREKEMKSLTYWTSTML